MTLKLDIGCGYKCQPGFIGVDRYVRGAQIVNCDMWNLPYFDDSVDEIYSSHALEHVEKRKVVPTLAEWRRVLKPGATATICVPDLEWCCRQWLEHGTTDWWMDILFGNQEHEGEFHKTGFTRDILTVYVALAGFTSARVNEVFDHRQNTLVFVVTK